MIHDRHHRRGTVIAVTSGKGGVGKTHVVVNLAFALARRGLRVGIVDADFGLGNVDVMLGLSPRFHIGHVLSGERTLEDVVVEGPLGIRIMPATSGVRALTSLDGDQWTRVASVVHALRRDVDFLLVDTAAGISDNVVELVTAADRALVVTSYDPASIVDAYALIKVVTATDARVDMGIVVSAVRDADEASLVFRQIEMAATKFLKRSLRYYGAIPSDHAVRESLLAQRPVVDHLPQARASRGFRLLASKVMGTAGVNGHLRLVPRPGSGRPGEVVPGQGGSEATLCA